MRLHGRGQVLVALLEGLFRRASMAKTLLEKGRKEASEHRRFVGLLPGHFRAALMMREITKIEAETDGSFGANDVAEFVKIRGRAISGEAHYLVFITELPEAKILRHRGVEHSERMRKCDRAIDANLRAFADSPHGAGEITQTVGREHGGTVKRGDKKCAGQMSLVVLNAMKLRANALRIQFECTGELFFDSGEAR